MLRILIALGLSLSTSAFATPIWEDIENQNVQLRSATSSNARTLTLDEETLRQQLESAGDSGDKALIELPLPDGTMEVFSVEEYSLLPKELAKKYPDIKTWIIRSSEGKNIRGRIDFTHTGFHAMLTLEDGDTIFIDPSINSDSNTQTAAKADKDRKTYNSFSKKNNKHLFIRDFRHIDDQVNAAKIKARTIAQRNLAKPAQTMLTYRLALATTGEYAALNGGTKKSVFSAMVTTINRVNEIYERDLSVRLTFVANNDEVIYLNANSDPFTNGDAYAMLDENIANMDAVIGTANYDIGHLFGGAGTGGLALLSGVCRANNISHKAGGITGSSSPYGDSFNIDYVSHEMGHQFGATHSFNSNTDSCGGNNREPDTAVEPGSGSTIMSYAGICGNNNLQTNSDALFNAINIEQINNYLRVNGEATCGIAEPTNNNSPSITIGSDYYIPTKTPFVLTSIGQDTDGDSLTYTWDEQDHNGTAVDLGLDTGDNPLFRSYLPSESNQRYFPSLSTLFGNQAIKGELLPVTDRVLSFAAIVRDNRGGISRADTNIITSGNPFQVTSHSTSHSYNAGEVINVSWDVASTNVLPINCQGVDIKLLLEDGTTRDLLLNTNNDGVQNFAIPTSTATLTHSRMMVACSDNIFFAAAAGNIAVEGINPIVTLNSPYITETDTTNTYLRYTVSLSSPTTQDASLNYLIRDESKKQVQGGIIRILEGESSAQVSQLITGNLIADGDRSYEFIVYSPQHLQFDAANAVSSIGTMGTVIDNDSGPINLTMTTISVTEGNSGNTSEALFKISLSHASSDLITVHYATTNGSALASSDYIPVNNTLLIPAGSTSAIIPVEIISDLEVEDNETFQLTLSNPSNGVVLTNSTATVTIINDDEVTGAHGEGDIISEPVTTETVTEIIETKQASGSFGGPVALLLFMLSIIKLRRAASK